jgi:hypothetical protein
MKRALLGAALLLAVASPAVTNAAPRAAVTATDVTLPADAPAFWPGTAAHALHAPLPACASYEAPCTDFQLRIRSRGARLRVAMDSPGTPSSDVAVAPGLLGAVTASSNGALGIFDSTGKSLASASGPYSMEAYVAPIGPGVYYARVTGVAPDVLRMRAEVESRLRAVGHGKSMLLPNLELTPPYQFTFASPAAPVIAGRDPVSCNPYEVEEYAAKRCLRFSLGPENVGTGALMLRFDSNIVQGSLDRIPVTQIVQRADGTYLERAGGFSVYHRTHMHYHHNGFGSLELLKVLNPATGQMAPAGMGPKQGFCTLDFKIAHWTKFDNVPAASVRQDCNVVESPSDVTQLGLDAGWGDIYNYHLDGNYVEFGENSDGLYVVRSIADAFNAVLETNENDNGGYAYIRVTGNSIKVLERGHGSSPWDPHKVLADDNMPLYAPPTT